MNINIFRYKKTALHQSCKATKPHSIKLASLLINEGADLTKKTIHGGTVLHEAAFYKNFPFIEYFLHFTDVAPFEKNFYGKRAFDILR